jgi:chemotaxis protein CheY-P-specific phosphatase CheC
MLQTEFFTSQPKNMANLSEQHVSTIKDAAKKLTGAKRQAFQAQVAIDYMNSKPYLAEKTFGWDRKTVALGLNELRTGLVCFDNFKARGNKKTKVKMPQLEIDIIALAEPESQIDPRSLSKINLYNFISEGRWCSSIHHENLPSGFGPFRAPYRSPEFLLDKD